MNVKIVCMIILILQVVGCSFSSGDDITSSPFESGGLGLSKLEWERLHGDASERDSAYSYYEDKQFILNFMDGRAGFIRRAYNGASPATLEYAREESKKLIPYDAKPVRSYAKSPNYVIDLYFSESLKQKFDSDSWIGGEPGDFIVAFQLRGNVVEYFTVNTGHNP